MLSRQAKGFTYEASSTNGGGSAGNDGFATAMDRRDRVINEFLDRLSPECLVVNIGCGVLRRFEPECPSRYLASDLRVLPHVDFAADAMSLPLADGSADTVIALELLEHVPHPLTVLQEMNRVLKPGGRAIVSVPSTVPRHDDHDFWRFTAQGLAQLCSEVFEDRVVWVFGGTFEALGHLGAYYTALLLHQVRLPSRRIRRVFPSIGYWIDQRSSWSTSTTALHTLAIDLLCVATTAADTD